MLFDAHGKVIPGTEPRPLGLSGANISLEFSEKLRGFFTDNPHLLNRYWTSVKNAVLYSFQQRETRVRNVTQAEVRQRIAYCAQIIEMGYFELHLPMIRILDTLHVTLYDAIRMSVAETVKQNAVDALASARTTSYTQEAEPEGMNLLDPGNEDVSPGKD